MGDIKLKSDYPQNEDNPDPCLECVITLMKDSKPISRTRCLNPPFKMPSDWNIIDIFRPKLDDLVPGLSQCILFSDAENAHQEEEWNKFMKFLKKYKRVAHAKVGSYDFYISAPSKGSNFGQAIVKYGVGKKVEVHEEHKHDFTASINKEIAASVKPGTKISVGGEECKSSMRKKSPGTTTNNPDGKSQEVVYLSHSCQVGDESSAKAKSSGVRKNGHLKSNIMRTHPSYLRTLGQSHSGWIFGAIAELVDNARDAKSNKLGISVEMVFSKTSGENIPMLSVIDDGHGMSHQDILRMISFGHEQPDEADPSRIGRYGIGFKTGAMRLGKDALVLTQTANSRSIAFLSQSFNEEKNSLEIPIVSYQRKGRRMDVDTLVQSEDLAKCNLKAIKDFSPFNEYLIGEKAGLFRENGTGTQIYIWNLDKWGSDYCLEWHNEKRDGSSHKGDILIRSRRVRSRPGQTSLKVPLDYSLQSYLEVMFLEPRMKIYVQGSQVNCRPLAKSLSGTVVEDGIIADKCVQLIMGRSQVEWEHANCGIFLYWHGRLIEAYKRVGGMVHSADTGRGVIGVTDVTEMMKDTVVKGEQNCTNKDKTNGQASVLNNKQGFQDCELYAQLEDWLGKKFNQFWDTSYDSLQVGKGSVLDKPDYDWVQCDKCRKWRMLSSGFDSKQLPLEWFCYMDPFCGKCEIPEQKVEPGVITVSTKRGDYDAINKPFKSQDECPKKSSDLLEEKWNKRKAMKHGYIENAEVPGTLGCKDADDLVEEDEVHPVWKRLRRKTPGSK